MEYENFSYILYRRLVVIDFHYIFLLIAIDVRKSLISFKGSPSHV